MDKEVIEDLKQFIAVTISQQTSDLREDITGIHNDITGIHNDITGIHNDITGIHNDIKRLDNKIDDLSDSVAQAISGSNDEVDKQLKDYETRITKLESHSA